MRIANSLRPTGRAMFGTATSRDCVLGTPQAISAARAEIDVDSIVRNAPSAQHPSVYRELVARVGSNEVARVGLGKFALPTNGLHSTTAHDAMLAELASKTRRLSEHGFYTKGDVASRTVLGPRGIGKSTTMRSFAAVAPLVFPNVIPLYIAYTSASTRGHSLVDTVSAALREYGVPVREASVDGIASSLEESEKYVLLLLDEIDNLYEAPLPPQPWTTRIWGRPWLPPATETLLNLAYIGDHTSGRFSTILCGSSAMLMDLITMDAATNKDSVALFPLLQRGLNLNCSKFKVLRLFYGSSVSLSNVGAVIGAGPDEHAWDEMTRGNVKLLTFIAGVAGTRRAHTAQLYRQCQHNRGAVRWRG